MITQQKSNYINNCFVHLLINCDMCMLLYFRAPKKKMNQSKKIESDIDDIALRAYELSKLRYYFAIATCDSNKTAEVLYKELDGLELEHSSMALDIRIVPNDIRYINLN